MRILLLTALLLAGCARVVAPSGGPEDKISPEITGVFPETGFCDAIPEQVVISYSEKIVAEKEMIEVYPDAEDVTIGKREIQIIPGFTHGVLSVTVSGELADTRGNRTGAASTFVWNTVPEEDYSTFSALVSRSGGGTVTETARCDLYLLPDTTSPLLTAYPDSAGGITAGWLPEGDYMIECYEDNDRSMSWDMEREAGVLEYAALSSGDTVLVALSMSITDSIGPTISAIEPLDGWHLEIFWNEQVAVPSASGEHVSITGPDGALIQVMGISASAGRSSTGRSTVYTAAMDDTVYSISVQGIMDLSGNPSLPDTLEIWGTDSLPDFPFAVQSAYPEDGGVDIPPGGPFMISFTDYIDLDNLDSLYSVTRVSDSVEVQGNLLRTSPTAFVFHPESELLGERQYRIDLDSGLVSLQGDTLAGDSWTFQPAWSDSPGSISGEFTGTWAEVITLVVSSAGGAGDDSTIKGKFSPGVYLLEQVPGGRYTVSCFVDWNQNELWDPGEPYGAWPGVVEVFPGTLTPDVNIQVVP